MLFFALIDAVKSMLSCKINGIVGEGSDKKLVLECANFDYDVELEGIRDGNSCYNISPETEIDENKGLVYLDIPEDQREVDEFVVRLRESNGRTHTFRYIVSGDSNPPIIVNASMASNRKGSGGASDNTDSKDSKDSSKDSKDSKDSKKKDSNKDPKKSGDGNGIKEASIPLLGALFWYMFVF